MQNLNYCCSLKEATDLVAGLLGGTVRLFTTQCVMQEIKALGSDYAGDTHLLFTMCQCVLPIPAQHQFSKKDVLQKHTEPVRRCTCTNVVMRMHLKLQWNASSVLLVRVTAALHHHRQVVTPIMCQADTCGSLFPSAFCVHTAMLHPALHIRSLHNHVRQRRKVCYVIPSIPLPFSQDHCFALGTDNEGHFFIGTQDKQLRGAISRVPAGASMFMSVNGLHLEQPSAKQEKVVNEVNLLGCAAC